MQLPSCPRQPISASNRCRYPGDARGRALDRRPNLGRKRMTTAETSVGALSDAEHHSQLRRALIASTVGTTIEWYDFLLYGQVTGLVFGKLFFPQFDPLVGVLQAFAVFFVGFLGGRLGVKKNDHWGDRIGRKGTLIA